MSEDWGSRWTRETGRCRCRPRLRALGRQLRERLGPDPQPAPANRPDRPSPPSRPTDLRRVGEARRDRCLPGAGRQLQRAVAGRRDRDACPGPTTRRRCRRCVATDGLPDLFLASRRDLDWLREGDLTAPSLELLDERGVAFGDGYSRDALLAFSADNSLQCLPYGVSPMVLYYNTELVDFERMARRGLPAPIIEPGRDVSWCFEAFVAAAEFATRQRLTFTRSPHRADDPRAGALRLLRRRPGLRRRGRADHDDLQRGEHPRSPDPDPAAAAQPAADPHRRPAGPGRLLGVVRARSARHARGDPRADPAAADRVDPVLRRDADAGARRRRDRGGALRTLRLLAVTRHRRGRGLPGRDGLERGGRPRRESRLPGARQPRGVAHRVVPAGGPPAGQRPGCSTRRSARCAPRWSPTTSTSSNSRCATRCATWSASRCSTPSSSSS